MSSLQERQQSVEGRLADLSDQRRLLQQLEDDWKEAEDKVSGHHPSWRERAGLSRWPTAPGRLLTMLAAAVGAQDFEARLEAMGLSGGSSALTLQLTTLEEVWEDLRNRDVDNVADIHMRLQVRPLSAPPRRGGWEGREGRPPAQCASLTQPPLLRRGRSRARLTRF